MGESISCFFLHWTYYDIATPYSIRVFGQHWFRELFPDNTRPLPEQTLIYHQWCLVTFTWEQSCRKYSRFLSVQLNLPNDLSCCALYIFMICWMVSQWDVTIEVNNVSGTVTVEEQYLQSTYFSLMMFNCINAIIWTTLTTIMLLLCCIVW